MIAYKIIIIMSYTYQSLEFNKDHLPFPLAFVIATAGPLFLAERVYSPTKQSGLADEILIYSSLLRVTNAYKLHNHLSPKGGFVRELNRRRLRALGSRRCWVLFPARRICFLQVQRSAQREDAERYAWRDGSWEGSNLSRFQRDFTPIYGDDRT